MTTIDIVVAEDEHFSRTGIVWILKEEPEFQIVGETGDGEEAVDLVLQLKPRILLLDVRMPPGIDGLEVIRRLRRQKSQVAIIVLTQEKPIIHAVREAGANGFIPKENHAMLVPTIRCMASSGSDIFINPELSKKYRELEERVRLAQLTEQEWEIWRLIGFKNDEIAQKLHKSSGRIRNIVADIYVKLAIGDEQGVSPRIQALEMARLLGILEPPSRFSE